MPIPNTTDCPPQARGEVDFQNYCNMMGPLGLTSICRDIHGTSVESQQVKRGLCQDNFGDGTAWYPQYGRIFGEDRVVRWQHVSYWNKLDRNTLGVFGDAIFLAGAFTLLQIPSIPTDYDTRKRLGIFREDLPIKLIEDIYELRRRCLGSGAMICLKDGSVLPLVKALNRATEHLRPRENEGCTSAKIRRFTGRLNQLKENYALLEGRVKDREKLTAAVAAYNKVSSGDSNSPEFLKNEIWRYRQMVKLAIMQYYKQDGKEMPTAAIEKMGIPTGSKKENSFGNGSLSLDDDYDDSIDGSDGCHGHRRVDPPDFQWGGSNPLK